MPCKANRAPSACGKRQRHPRSYAHPPPMNGLLPERTRLHLLCTVWRRNLLSGFSIDSIEISVSRKLGRCGPEVERELETALDPERNRYGDERLGLRKRIRVLGRPEPAPQGLQWRVRTYDEICGELAIEQHLIIDHCLQVIVHGPSRQVLQAQIPVAVDGRAAQPGLQVGRLGCVDGQEIHGRAKRYVAQRLGHAGILRGIQAALQRIRVNGDGVRLAQQENVVAALQQVFVGPDGSRGEDIKKVAITLLTVSRSVSYKGTHWVTNPPGFRWAFTISKYSLVYSVALPLTQGWMGSEVMMSNFSGVVRT